MDLFMFRLVHCIGHIANNDGSLRRVLFTSEARKATNQRFSMLKFHYFGGSDSN